MKRLIIIVFLFIPVFLSAQQNLFNNKIKFDASGNIVNLNKYMIGDTLFIGDTSYFVKKKDTLYLHTLKVFKIDSPYKVAGLTGVTGVTGVTGLQGIQGLTGVTGVTGATGEQGVQGITGVTGVQGVTGATGSASVINFSALTGNTTLDNNYGFVTTSGAITITLPTAVGCAGREYTIKKIDATTTLIVMTTSAQTIDGDPPPLTLTVRWVSLSFVSDGSNWLIK